MTRAALLLVVVAAAAIAAPPVRAPHLLGAPDAGLAGAPRAPQRIVSLAPVLTETLFTLGAGPRVVGVTRFCDRPPEATTRPKVGGYVDVQLEAVLAAAPDLVVAMPSLGQGQALSALAQAGVPVAVFFGDTLAEVRALVRGVAVVVGNEDAGRALVADMDARLKAVRARAPARGRRVLVLVGVDPIVAAGPGTFADEILTILGATRALAATAPGWPQLSLESLLALAPTDVLVAEGPLARARVDALLAAVPPERRPRVHDAAGPVLMRPGPALADDVERVARVFAP